MSNKFTVTQDGNGQFRAVGERGCYGTPTGSGSTADEAIRAAQNEEQRRSDRADALTKEQSENGLGSFSQWS